MATIKLDAVAETVMKDLEEYTAKEVPKTIQETVKEAAPQYAKWLQGASRSAVGGSGKYAKGWKADVQVERLGASATLYNTMPGLPHLLEFGHANRGGGRTPGHPHIKDTEDRINEDFMKRLEGAL